MAPDRSIYVYKDQATVSYRFPAPQNARELLEQLTHVMTNLGVPTEEVEVRFHPSAYDYDPREVEEISFSHRHPASEDEKVEAELQEQAQQEKRRAEIKRAEDAQIAALKAKRPELFR